MADTATQRVLTDILGVAGDLAGGDLALSVKTNLGPEFGVGSVSLAGGGGGRSSSGGGVSGILGIRAAVIVRDARGRLVANLGDPPATDYLRVSLLIGLAALFVLVVAKGLRRAV